MKNLHFINLISMQYSNDSAEIKARKTDLWCASFLEVYDSTVSRGVSLKKF